MTKLILVLIFICLPAFACSQKQETPEYVAKSFVQSYYFSEDRSSVLSYTTDDARTKIILENEYLKKLEDQKSEIERPAFFSLLDSIPMSLNFTQFTFLVHYQANVPHIENMFVMMKRDHNVWKVSDYRFSLAGE